MTATPPSSTTETAAPTTASAPSFPPATVSDLRGLAALGDASAVHEFRSESTGDVGICPQPKRLVTVAPSLTGQQLAEDLLAYFYTQALDSPCGSLVGAYHDQSEATDAYTAGRILLEVTDSSGATNTNPRATGLKHRLTLDVGGVPSEQAYVVAY
ncbi:MAG: hypothetical protein ACREN2_06135 [Candidatus Dormibacteria bacterium]